MININKKIIQILILLLLLITSSSFSLAVDEEGEGGGLNQDEPITLVNCNLQDNQTGVKLDAVIHMEFNKNVVNRAVAENNRKCISLSDEKGNAVSIEVKMGDDQVDPSIKRQIDVIPDINLEQGMFYTLTISKDFMAKNGTVLNTPITLRFQTEVSSLALKDNTEFIETQNTEKSSSPEQPQEEPQVKSQYEPIRDRKEDILLYFSVGCIAVAVILFALYFRRRNK